MNCASARCRRASWPRNTVKRAPLILAAVSPSSQPLRAPSSTWSFTAKSKVLRRAERLLFDVLAFVAAQRHRGVRQVRDAQGDRLDLAAQVVELDFRCLQLVAERSDFGHHRRHVLALGLEHADLLAAGIAQVLQLLGAHLQLLATCFQRFEVADVQLEAAAGAQAFGEFGGIGAQQGGIEHREGLPWTNAHYRRPGPPWRWRNNSLCQNAAWSIPPPRASRCCRHAW